MVHAFKSEETVAKELLCDPPVREALVCKGLETGQCREAAAFAAFFLSTAYVAKGILCDVRSKSSPRARDAEKGQDWLRVLFPPMRRCLAGFE
jgi:hypothetical protein